MLSEMSAKVRNGDAGDAKPEVVWATCVCCGLMEECTSAYVARVRERYGGSWVCGLCGEAVKDEIRRSGHRISTEEALSRHISFSESFRSASPPIDTAEHLITAMRQLLRRSLESPRAMRSTPNSPQREAEGEDGAVSSDAARRSLARSGSCFSTLSR